LLLFFPFFLTSFVPCDLLFISGLWIRIRIGSAFNHLVDPFPDSGSGSSGKKMKLKLYLSLNVFPFYFKKLCCGYGSVLDPDSMNSWIRTRIESIRIHKTDSYF
jgi:hypothetical protein